MLDITSTVEEAVVDMRSDGVCHLFVIHTTAALTTADLDPGGTEHDYINVFNELISEPAGGFNHPHDPSHMPDHILSSLIGTSISVPVKEGKLVLGTWQRVVLVELDGPRERTVVVSVSS